MWERSGTVLRRWPLELAAVAAFRWATRLNGSGRHRAALTITLLIRVLTGIEIEVGAQLGQGVEVRHGVGLVVGHGARIGDRCVLHQNVTLGVADQAAADDPSSYPVLEDDVTVYAGASVLGPVRVGRGAVVAAHAVVVDDVPPGATVVGAPARVIRRASIAGAQSGPAAAPEPQAPGA